MELQKARDKEQKYNKYLAKQRERLASHAREKAVEDEKKMKKDAEAKKKEARDRKKQQRDHEAKKRAIEAYKEKKRNAEELLANADLDDLDSDEEDYQLYTQPNKAKKDDEYDDDVEGSEGDASRYLDKMIEMYKDKAEETGRSGVGQRKARPPPAVMWTKTTFIS